MTMNPGTDPSTLEQAPQPTSANGAQGGEDQETQTPVSEETHGKPTVQAFQELADQYMVPMSEQTLTQLTTNPAPDALEHFAQYVKSAAAGLYPTLAKQIMAGIPTDILVDPYRQVAKQVLGDDFEPDFTTDPKSAAALNGNFDPQTGRPAPMTLNQWQQHLKSDPGFGWASTPQAMARSHQIIQALQQGFSQPSQGDQS